MFLNLRCTTELYSCCKGSRKQTGGGVLYLREGAAEGTATQILALIFGSILVNLDMTDRAFPFILTKAEAVAPNLVLPSILRAEPHPSSSIQSLLLGHRTTSAIFDCGDRAGNRTCSIRHLEREASDLCCIVIMITSHNNVTVYE